jgi:hypothetical protein
VTSGTGYGRMAVLQGWGLAPPSGIRPPFDDRLNR